MDLKLELKSRGHKSRKEGEAPGTCKGKKCFTESHLCKCCACLTRIRKTLQPVQLRSLNWK